MSKIERTMTDDIFNELIVDDKWCHKIAGACGYCKSNGEHIGYHTTSYPVVYNVTIDQINKAKAIYEERRDALIADTKTRKGVLTFIGMGMEYAPIDEDDVGNFRVRCRFLDKDDVVCFIEVDTFANRSWLPKELQESGHKALWVDYAIKNYGGDNEECVVELERKQSYDNCIPYTKSNIIKIVNAWFGTEYTSMVIEEYFINTDDYINYYK